MWKSILHSTEYQVSSLQETGSRGLRITLDSQLNFLKHDKYLVDVEDEISQFLENINSNLLKG
jgi:hypothetical protein